MLSYELCNVLRNSLECENVSLHHSGLAEIIAPDGGPGSDIIVVRFQPRDNSWVQDGSSNCKINPARWGHWVGARWFTLIFRILTNEIQCNMTKYVYLLR